jgi:osmoprotectant transport system substrate-binding protein
MRRFAMLATLSLAATLLVSACAPGAAGGRPAVRVGSTNFSEQVVLAELYSQVLETNGYRVERKFNLGSREVVAPALEAGEIDMYPEYMATYVTFLNKGDTSKASTDPVATYRNLLDTMRGKNITVLDYAPAVDTNGFVVTRDRSSKDNLKKVSDLARFNGQLTLGGPPECPQRPFCQVGLQNTYGVQVKEFKPLDVGGPLTVAALEANQIDVGVLFTTDAAIQVKNFVLLEDDKRLQNADNVAPVVRNDLLDKALADFKPLINGVTTRMTTEELTGLNKQVGVDRKDPKDVARDWLRAKQLVR